MPLFLAILLGVAGGILLAGVAAVGAAQIYRKRGRVGAAIRETNRTVLAFVKTNGKVFAYVLLISALLGIAYIAVMEAERRRDLREARELQQRLADEAETKRKRIAAEEEAKRKRIGAEMGWLYFMGDCLLEVDRRAYLDGPCKIEMKQGENLIVFGVGETERSSKYVAYVFLEPDTPGVARRYWNGVEAASHAHDELGPLSKDGECWVNDRAKVCAWRLGTRPK